jgi:hypothetical protein
MLVNQHLRDHPVQGQIIFSADDEHRLEWCRWRFKNADYEFFKDCGFRYHLMALMDQLIEYRHSYNQPNSDHGIIDISGQSVSIRWVDSDEVEQVCAQEYHHDT